MKKLVMLDPKNYDFQRMIRRRRLMGGDRFDEVWNGVYVMAPDADIEHQILTGGFTHAIIAARRDPDDYVVLPGTNVSDRETDWRKNYRVPDIAVFFPGNPAQARGSHYLGGPDFAVEIISRGDRSRKKFTFYAAVGVRELLIVDRFPWSLELYRNVDGVFERVGRSDESQPDELISTVLPLTFRLRPGDPRPRIEATRPEDGQSWLI